MTRPPAEARILTRESLGRAAFVIVAVLGAWLTVAFARRWSTEYLGNVVDDSLISMQYARRLATGEGLVFNPGERVEGYTNFLWCVAMAPVYWLSRLFGGDFVDFAVGTSILVAAADVILVAVIARQLWGPRAVPLLVAVGLCAFDNSYTVWAMMALESHFVALFLLGALALYQAPLRRRALWTGLCLAAVPMARPDGALFVAAFAASESLGIGWTLLRRDASLARARLRTLAVTLGVFALVFGAYFAWRYAYYGYPFPNTYYLKVGSSSFDASKRGLDYAKTFVEERGGVPLLALLALPWLGNRTVRTLVLWIAVHVAYVIHVGGDFYPGHRFFVVLLPALSLLIGHAIHGWLALARRPRIGRFLGRIGVRSALVALAAVYGLGLVGQTFVIGLKKGPLELEIRAWRYEVDKQKRYMQWLRTQTRPDEYICVGDIGSAGLYADLRVIDYYGVIDPVTAHRDVATLGRGKPGHEKTAKVDYVLGRRPKYIKAGYLPGIFWGQGYVLRTDIPRELGIHGFWVRDDLPATGHFDAATALHFDPGDYGAWQRSGNAFDRIPSDRPGPGQRALIGVEGSYLSSFHPERGDAATGRLVSPSFALLGDRMVLRVAGGHDPEKLRVSLVVDGTRRFSETGSLTEYLGRREWDIAPYKGKHAVLEIVDDATGPWGHLVVDEVLQWTAR